MANEPRFLIDVNLPERIRIWHGANYIHVCQLDREWTDSQFWEYARRLDLVIVSKDWDFTNRLAISNPPPRVVQICVGNMKLREFKACLERSWPWVVSNVTRCRSVRVFENLIEATMDE